MKKGKTPVLTEDEARDLLTSIPVGLNVVTINLGKHTDKLKEDLPQTAWGKILTVRSTYARNWKT